MEKIFIQTLAQCIFSYMKAENITTITAFNEKNNFTPLKTAVLPFLIASASENITTGFELYQPWKLEQIIPRDAIRQPKVSWERNHFHGSQVVPFIDFPSSIVNINYSSRYRTIVPQNYITTIKEFFSEWKEHARLHISNEQEIMLRKSDTQPIIASSLELLEERTSNPITYEMRTLSCLLDRSTCIQVIRLFNMDVIPLSMLTDYGHVFARNPEQRILI